MKAQIRRCVFETNSSSVHSIAMCTRSEFDDWKDGKLYRNNGWWSDTFSPLKDKYFLTYDEAIELINSSRWYREIEEDEDIGDYFKEFEIYDYENWREDFETDVNHYTTPNGEEIVAVCYYGHD